MMFNRGRSPIDATTSDVDDARSTDNITKPAAARLSEKHARAHARKRNIAIVVVLGFVGLLALALGLGLGLGLKRSPESRSSNGPNVLVIMTDDQDMLLDSMSVMPNVNNLIGSQGVTYSKHYCTVAWCCPSRVNFFTGRAAHNTNVTSLTPPYGGWQKFAEEGLNDNYLPVWINAAGIETYYVGKFLNGYGRNDFTTPSHPAGWTSSSFLVDPWTYAYYNSHWTNNETSDIEPFIGTHTTDVTKSKALDMLDGAASSGNQFFMMVAPVAPHQETWHGTRPPPIPEAYRGKFTGAQAPRTGNFNPDTPSGASWVYNMEQLDANQIETCDNTHVHRLGNIAAIDDMVSELIQKLDDHGILDNTYIVYTSDNGFHIGNHRLLPGKRCPYEEDINIPLLIRGPDVAKGVQSNIVNSHTDIAPTVLQMLGVPTRDDFDGAPLAYTDDDLSSSTKQELVNVEFWTGVGHPPIGFKSGSYYNNTYKALRILSGNESFFYSTWCTNEREFYDMNTDIVQMNNRLDPNAADGVAEYFGRPWDQIVTRLDALLMVTKSCAADTCRDPWSVLFPSGQVTDLESAMGSQYDSFFKSQPQVSFTGCGAGYFPDMEGPQSVVPFVKGQNRTFVVRHL